MDRDLAQPLPLAENPEHTLTSREPHIVHVERDRLGDPRTRVERHQRQRPVTRRRARLHRSQIPDLSLRAERPRRGAGQLSAFRARRTQAASAVEVVHRRQRVVDRRPAALQHRLQMPAVAADRPIPPRSGAERVTVELRARQPCEVLPDLRRVRPARLTGQWRRRQRADVRIEHDRELGWELGREPSAHPARAVRVL
jgi:hypothetical protein